MGIDLGDVTKVVSRRFKRPFEEEGDMYATEYRSAFASMRGEPMQEVKKEEVLQPRIEEVKKIPEQKEVNVAKKEAKARSVSREKRKPGEKKPKEPIKKVVPKQEQTLPKRGLSADKAKPKRETAKKPLLSPVKMAPEKKPLLSPEKTAPEKKIAGLAAKNTLLRKSVEVKKKQVTWADKSAVPAKVGKVREVVKVEKAKTIVEKPAATNKAIKGTIK